MDDSMWGHIHTEAAQSKRPNVQDAPSQQPMRAGIKPAQQRKPSGDQKKVRRQMAKNADVGGARTLYCDIDGGVLTGDWDIVGCDICDRVLNPTDPYDMRSVGLEGDEVVRFGHGGILKAVQYDMPSGPEMASPYTGSKSAEMSDHRSFPIAEFPPCPSCGSTRYLAFMDGTYSGHAKCEVCGAVFGHESQVVAPAGTFPPVQWVDYGIGRAAAAAGPNSIWAPQPTAGNATTLDNGHVIFGDGAVSCPDSDKHYTARQTSNGPVCPNCSKSLSTSTKESSTMNATPTEATLLTALASAKTLAEQTEAAQRLEEFRATQRESAAAGMAFGWDDMGALPPTLYAQSAQSLVDGGLVNTTASVRLGHTEATNWMDDLTPTTTPDAVLAANVRATATHWFTDEVWAPVKQDEREFSSQAFNAASRTATAYGLQREAAKSVFLDQVKHLASREGIRLLALEDSVPTYVSDGRDSLPVGVSPTDPSAQKSLDEWDHGTDNNASTDPKTTPGAGNAPSLSEGDSPETGSSEGVENPVAGTDADASTHDVGNTEDKLLTQQSSRHTALSAGDEVKVKVGDTDRGTGTIVEQDGNAGGLSATYKVKLDSGETQSFNESNLTKVSAKTAGEYKGGSPKEGDTAKCHKDGGAIQFFDGQWMHLKGTGDSHNDVYPATPREQAEKEGSIFSRIAEFFTTAEKECKSCGGTGRISQGPGMDLGPGFPEFFDCPNCNGTGKTGSAHHADNSPDSTDGLGGIQEGDTPETGHSEGFQHTPPRGNLDASSGGGEWGSADSINTGGTPGSNAAQSQEGAYTSKASLTQIGQSFRGKPVSENTRTFAASLERCASIDDSVGGVSARQIVSLLVQADDVPVGIKRHLASHLASEGGATCSNCGGAIERDPEGEKNRGWHHADGSKHEHEARPGGDHEKESAKTADIYDDGMGGTPGPTNSWNCEKCGEHLERWRGETDVSCHRCGAQYNASGQRLRDDWAGNPSNWDSEIGDMEGFEMQHAHDASLKEGRRHPFAREAESEWGKAHPGKERCAKTEQIKGGGLDQQRYVRCQGEKGHDGEHTFDESKATPAPTASKTAAEGRPLYEIAADIKRNWPDVYFGAVPYLDALGMLSSMDDKFGEDDAKTIVAYLISNMRYWRGPEAARLKAELKALVGRKASKTSEDASSSEFTQDHEGAGHKVMKSNESEDLDYCATCQKKVKPRTASKTAKPGAVPKHEHRFTDYGYCSVGGCSVTQGKTQTSGGGYVGDPKREHMGAKTASDGCTCATNSDGTKTTLLCPVHATEDPCWTMARVTGRRRQGSIIRGVCTNCGWSGGSREASAKTATYYCTTHQVYVGDGNRDTHTRDSCNVEQRKKKESAQNGCYYSYEPHHSDDLTEVWSGHTTPVLVCGYHLSKHGVPQRAPGPDTLPPEPMPFSSSLSAFAQRVQAGISRVAEGADYTKGFEQGRKDHESASDLSTPEMTKGWDRASEEWKRGWSDGYEEAAGTDRLASRRMAANHSRCDHKSGYCEVLRDRSLKEPFSISDAKNEDGEWIMSPEQIRSEMNYGPGGPYYDPSDEYDPYDHYEGSRRVGFSMSDIDDPTSTEMTPGRWVAEVLGDGEYVWSRNSLSFDTEEDARVYVTSLARRWFGMDVARVRQIPAGGLPPTHTEPYDEDDPTIVLNYRDTRRLSAKERPFRPVTAGEQCPGSGQPMKNQRERNTEDAKFFGWALGECPSCGTLVRSKSSKTPNHKAESKESSKTAMPNPADLGIEVGDIFYSSWGYDQTNIDFYEVTRLMGASVAIRPIKSRVVETHQGGESVVAVPSEYGGFTGGAFTKRVRDYGSSPSLSLNSYSNAYLWDGKPKFTNGGIWGR